MLQPLRLASVLRPHSVDPTPSPKGKEDRLTWRTTFKNAPPRLLLTDIFGVGVESAESAFHVAAKNLA